MLRRRTDVMFKKQFWNHNTPEKSGTTGSQVSVGVQWYEIALCWIKKNCDEKVTVVLEKSNEQRANLDDYNFYQV